MRKELEAIKKVSILYVEDEPLARDELVYFLKNKVLQLLSKKRVQ